MVFLARRVAILLAAALLLAGCTRVFFQPMRPLVRTPAAAGLEWEDVSLRAADGTTLFAWFLPVKAGTPRGTILFLHGNAENISTHLGSVWWLPARGYQVLLLDYRGYGKSSGKASLAGVQLDIDAALSALRARPDVDPARIVLLGQSLGGALALHYTANGAQREVIRAVVTDSAFSSYRGIARELIAAGWLTGLLRWPLALVIDDDYSPIRSVQRIAPTPLLLIHGTRDTIVPADHARLLFDAAGEPRTLWLVPEAGHIGSLQRPDIRDRLIDYLNDVLGM
jgi:fermentation-respiration switch protein FrsA (DUF1100 family)